MSTNLGLLNDGITWAYVVGVIAVAFSGKIIGGTLAARACKLVWRESFSIGVLMSCKGLVELIVLVSSLNSFEMYCQLTVPEYWTASQDPLHENFHHLRRDGACHNSVYHAFDIVPVPTLVPEETRCLEERRDRLGWEPPYA